ncbi:MAG: hypothetical protein ACI3T9_05705 [Romboutsia timonensis]
MMSWEEIVDMKRELVKVKSEVNILSLENARLIENLAKKEREYRLLGEYYECAMQQADEMADICWEKDEQIEIYQDKLTEAGQKLVEKDKEIALLQQRMCRAEGKLEKAENYLRMFSGRENW